MVNFGEFWKPEACGQTVLPDRTILIVPKLVENAKIQVRHFLWETFVKLTLSRLVKEIKLVNWKKVKISMKFTSR